MTHKVIFQEHAEIEKQREEEAKALRLQFEEDKRQQELENQKMIDSMNRELANTKAETAAEQLKIRKIYDQQRA